MEETKGGEVGGEDGGAANAAAAAAATAAAAAVAAASEMLTDLARWNDSNHECLLFNNHSHKFSFLSLDPGSMRKAMHPGLLSHLEKNEIQVGENLDLVGPKVTHHRFAVMGALTGVHHSFESASKLLGGQFNLTGDAMLKMLALLVRVRCGIPVVLMGECGCGKTYLITYVCAWLRVHLLTLDVHGGTTEADILGIFQRGLDLLEEKGDGAEVYIFLDEVNTCAHMGLITEAICQHSVGGRSLPDAVHILAALNPYRLRPASDDVTPGLVYSLHGDATPDPMAALVYRVHPVPPTLQDLVFDFGALTPKKEGTYILSMVEHELTDVLSSAVQAPNVTDKGRKEVVDAEVLIVTLLLVKSQAYVREVEGDESAVSLRDVRRALRLLKWFMANMVQPTYHPPFAAKPGKGREGAAPLPPASPLAQAIALSLAHVYMYRLSHSKQINHSRHQNKSAANTHYSR